MRNCVTLFLGAAIAAFASPLRADDLATYFQASDSTAGSEVLTYNDWLYVATTDTTSTHPSNADRVCSLSVTLPEAGDYNVFFKVYIYSASGDGTDSDSFYVANEFGTPSISDSTKWVTIDNLATGTGYYNGSSIVDDGGEALVTGSSGGVSSSKWVNASSTGGVTYHVDTANTTLTLEFAFREKSLMIGTVAFAKSDLYFTVTELNNELPGALTKDFVVPVGPCIAVGKSKFLGSEHEGTSEPYFDTWWNQVTPGNGGKWGTVEATKDVMVWTTVDNSYAEADQYDMIFKYHTLIWGSQQPSWIESMSTADQLTQITEWFDAVATHFQGKHLDYIDVVNEPLHCTPSGSGTGNYMAALGGSGTTGWDWVIKAFEMARAKFPDSKLVLNDYNIIQYTSATTSFITICNLLKDRNLIDAIGLQEHGPQTSPFLTTTLETNLNRLAALGIPILISEFDVNGPTDAVQLSEMQRLFPMYWENDAVTGITMWGYKPPMWQEDAYLMNDRYVERPAMTWLRDYVQSEAWLGYTTTRNWSDTGTWLGYVYSGYKPTIYTSCGLWMWALESSDSDAGAWLYVYRSDDTTAIDTSSASSTWHGFPVDQSGDYAETGAWLGNVFMRYDPYIWSYKLNRWAYVYDSATVSDDNPGWLYIYK